MRRFIDIPGQLREPGPDLLRRLREHEPRAEALYVGAGRWWLGRVKTDSARRQPGREMAALARAGDGYALADDWEPTGDRWHALRQGLLMSQGFGFLSEVVVRGEPDARLVEELRRLMYAERGGVIENEAAKAEEDARRRRVNENRVRERDTLKWLWARHPGARGNPRPVSVPHTYRGERAA